MIVTSLLRLWILEGYSLNNTSELKEIWASKICLKGCSSLLTYKETKCEIGTGGQRLKISRSRAAAHGFEPFGWAPAVGTPCPRHRPRFMLSDWSFRLRNMEASCFASHTKWRYRYAAVPKQESEKYTKRERQGPNIEPETFPSVPGPPVQCVLVSPILCFTKDNSNQET